MCLILFALNNHPNYKLVVAANRDEFYKRPTADAGFWEDHSHVLAGRDLEGGGTWMGVNRNGRIAMLTNYRDFSMLKERAPSRGHLVADYLKVEQSTSSYLESLEETADNYNGYNIILGDPDKLFYFSNIGKQIKSLSSGVFGLSNHLLDTSWPKVEKGREKLKTALAKDVISEEDLFAALYDDIKAPDNLLPDTGIGIDKERMLSSMFIKSPDYGSRCSTVVLVDRKDHVTFVERVYNIEDYSYNTNKFEFQKQER